MRLTQAEHRAVRGGVPPTTPQRLSGMTSDDADRVAAFLARFEKLVEPFRAAVVLAGEEHEHRSARQVRDRVGRLGLLADPDGWGAVVEARDHPAHVHPLGDGRVMEALNAARAQAVRAVDLIAPLADGMERRLEDLS